MSRDRDRHGPSRYFAISAAGIQNRPDHRLNAKEFVRAAARIAENVGLSPKAVALIAMKNLWALAEAAPPGEERNRLIALAAGIAAELLPFEHQKLPPVKPQPAPKPQGSVLDTMPLDQLEALVAKFDAGAPAAEVGR